MYRRLRPPSVEGLPLLNHAFWWAEIANKEDGTKFLFSQFVAGGVANLFDGMIVPGVRGDDSTRYDNIVIFRPDRWRDWFRRGVARSGCQTGMIRSEDFT